MMFERDYVTKMVYIFIKRFRDLINDKCGGNYTKFSKLSHIPKTTISGWVNKNQLPRAEHLATLSDFFAVSTDYLLGLEDEFGNKVKLTNPSVVVNDESKSKVVLDKEVEKNLKNLNKQELEIILNLTKYFSKKK